MILILIKSFAKLVKYIILEPCDIFVSSKADIISCIVLLGADTGTFLLLVYKSQLSRKQVLLF
uniref:Uncharacterized protein n=1 Tax=Manihot esculenta TaxID=3983 RepID=A0A2C9VJH8_MANES